MSVRVPFDRVRQRPTSEQTPIFRQTKMPVQIPTTDRLCRSCRKGRISNELVDIIAIHNPGEQNRLYRKLRPNQGIIQTKPARPPRRFGIRIYGDNFKEDSITKPHQVIVSPHLRMNTAKGHPDTQLFFHISNTLFKGLSGNDQMVDMCLKVGHI